MQNAVKILCILNLNVLTLKKINYLDCSTEAVFIPSGMDHYKERSAIPHSAYCGHIKKWINEIRLEVRRSYVYSSFHFPHCGYRV